MEKSLPKGVKTIPRKLTGARSMRDTEVLCRSPADAYTIHILNLSRMGRFSC